MAGDFARATGARRVVGAFFAATGAAFADLSTAGFFTTFLVAAGAGRRLCPSTFSIRPNIAFWAAVGLLATIRSSASNFSTSVASRAASAGSASSCGRVASAASGDSPTMISWTPRMRRCSSGAPSRQSC